MPFWKNSPFLASTSVLSMPHTARKTRPALGKRRYLQDEGGWTHVAKGPSHRNFNFQALLPRILKNTSDGSLDEDRICRTAVGKGLSLDKVQQSFARMARKWKESMFYPEIKNAFEGSILKLESLQVTSCVCLALGSFATDDFHGRPGSSEFQLVALETMLHILRAGFRVVAIDIATDAC